jgi:hypothetical protein
VVRDVCEQGNVDQQGHEQDLARKETAARHVERYERAGDRPEGVEAGQGEEVEVAGLDSSYIYGGIRGSVMQLVKLDAVGVCVTV